MYHWPAAAQSKIWRVPSGSTRRAVTKPHSGSKFLYSPGLGLDYCTLYSTVTHGLSPARALRSTIYAVDIPCILCSEYYSKLYSSRVGLRCHVTEYAIATRSSQGFLCRPRLCCSQPFRIRDFSLSADLDPYQRPVHSLANPASNRPDSSGRAFSLSVRASPGLP